MNIIIFPGGFHPFHKGHAKTYSELTETFPEADVFVASSPNTDERPFEFEDKKKLALYSGVPEDKFVEVKSPYRAEEIYKDYNSEEDILIYAMSTKDAGRLNFTKKDGTPAYFQPYDDTVEMEPFSKHAYVYVTPVYKFEILGEPITSASQIREKYTEASEEEKMNIIKTLYKKDQKKAKQIFDKTLTSNINESDGTYGCYKLTEKSALLLESWMEAVGIVEPVAKKDFHVTTRHTSSVVNLPPEKKMVSLDHTGYALDMFGDAFVLVIDSADLQELHQRTLQNGATWEYDSYRPHITLSYNASANEKILPGLMPPDFDIVLSHEVIEPLKEEVLPEDKPKVKKKWVIKKKPKLVESHDKKRTAREEEKIQSNLETLLRYGLVPKSLLARARRALLDKKTAAKVPYLRDILIDVLEHVLDLVLSNPLLYHRMLRDVMVQGPIIKEANENGEMVEKQMYRIPSVVASSASEGIELRKTFHRGGSSTAVSVAKMINEKDEVDINFVKKLAKHLNRNEPNRKEGWDDPDKPSNSYITWKMLGGDAALTWTSRILNRNEE